MVNDTPNATPLTFEPTGDWSSWSTVSVNVSLKRGTSNAIRVESTGDDAGNTDQLFVTK